MTPEDLSYTAQHEWVRITDAGTVVFGITDYAQDALGDIVYVTLPEEGSALVAGEPCGEVESTKSVSDVYAPVTGTVVARNAGLDAAPETVNSDPYGDGWMVEVRVEAREQLDSLLDAAAYEGLLGQL